MLSKKVIKNARQMTNRGFTLVEVMIGMAIFLIGFLAVSSLQTTAIKGNTGARKATEAATRAPNENVLTGLNLRAVDQHSMSRVVGEPVARRFLPVELGRLG